MSAPQRVPLPCGCAVVASHERGDVMYRCAGSDGASANGVRSINRCQIRPCPGGVTYAVAAEEITAVVYTPRAVTLPGGGDEAA